MYKKFFLPMSLLAGAVIGGGVFSLPFIFAQVGLVRGVLYMVVIAFLMMVIYLMYADILVNTPGKHNYVSLSKLYLGELAEIFSIGVTVVTMILILFIYLILASRFMNLIWAGPPWLVVLPFWLFGSAAVFLNLKRLALVEFLTSILIALIIFLIFLWSLPHFSSSIFQNFLGSKFGGISNWFWLPIGPLIFSFSGRAGIYEVVSYDSKNAKKNITFSYIGIFVLYLLFILGILFLTGGIVSDDTITGLGGRLPPFLLVLIGTMGLVALWHVYIILGFDASSILNVDLRLSKTLSNLVVIFVPLLLYFINWQSFFALISLVGGLLAAAENIFIILMWFKIKSLMPKFLGYLGLTVFVAIFVHELVVHVYAPV